MKVVAALDFGSNTLKLTVASLTPAGALEVRFEDAVITRIGEGLDKNGYLLDAAMERTLVELRRLADLARAHGAQEIAAVGTAGLRGARNAEAFLARVKAETGFEVEVIHGLREAELAFAAPSIAFGPGPVAVMDLGGRSTELAVGQGPRITARTSLEIGSVRLTERALPSDPPSPAMLENAKALVREALAARPALTPDTTLVGVSGTVQALLGLELGIHDAARLADEGEGRTLHRASVEEWLQRLAVVPAAERVRGTILPPLRADVILGGMIIVLETMAAYGRDEMGVSGRGVRYGLLLERLRP